MNFGGEKVKCGKIRKRGEEKEGDGRHARLRLSGF